MQSLQMALQGWGVPHAAAVVLNNLEDLGIDTLVELMLCWDGKANMEQVLPPQCKLSSLYTLQTRSLAHVGSPRDGTHTISECSQPTDQLSPCPFKVGADDDVGREEGGRYQDPKRNPSSERKSADDASTPPHTARRYPGPHRAHDRVGHHAVPQVLTNRSLRWDYSAAAVQVNQ